MSITPSKTVPLRRSLNQQAGATAQILALFLAVLIFTSLVVAFIGYQVGHRQGVHAAKDLKSDQAVSADVNTLAAENAKLKEDVDALTKERDISMGNLERLTEEQKALETKNLQLAQVNDLLKSSVAEQGGVALKVIGSEIGSLPENTFEYRFDVAMLDISGKAVTMIPKLTLLNETSMVEIPLDPPSYDVRGVANIRGRFIMPEGFEPKQMKIELAAGTQKVQKLYNWQIGKIITDAPPSLSEMSSTSYRPIVKSDAQ